GADARCRRGRRRPRRASRRHADRDRGGARNDGEGARIREPDRPRAPHPDRAAPARAGLDRRPRRLSSAGAREARRMVGARRRRPAPRARARVDGVRLPDADRVRRGRERRPADPPVHARLRRDRARRPQDPEDRRRRHRGGRHVPRAPAARFRGRRAARARGVVPGRACGPRARRLRDHEAVRRERARAAHPHVSRRYRRAPGRPERSFRQMLKWLVRIVLGLVALFVLAQAVPYGRSHKNPSAQSEPRWASAQTRQLARRACFDCHSNLTTWPWYSNVAPVSWLVYRDVVDGRSNLNFSEWNQPQDGAGDAVEAVSGGSMPPWYYTIMHPKAKLIQGLAATLRKSPPKGGGG